MYAVEKRKKWDSKTQRRIIVGYSDTVKGHRVWLAEARSVKTYRDVKVLNENVEREAVIFKSTNERQDEDKSEQSKKPESHDQEEEFQDASDTLEPEDISDKEETVEEMVSDDESSNKSEMTDDEAEWKAPVCMKPNTDLIDWVQCDQCLSWYHNQYVRVQRQDVENREYNCDNCEATSETTLVSEEPSSY